MDVDTRRLRPKLRGWQIYSITIGGIIGIGFFTNAGEVVSVAGPGGAVIGFFVVGVVAVCVMEGICEMIMLWPIPNAMVEFVRTFVDEDLATAIGIGYCYTYTVTFSALILSASNLATYWNISSGLQSTILAVAPLAIAFINLLWIEVFGWIEAIGGFLKLALVAFVFILMILVNKGVVGGDNIGTRYWSTFVETNLNVANSKAEAILIAIPKVTFAYIGVELLTMTAYEARNAGQLRWTAMTIAPQVCVLYVAVVATFVSNVSWDDPRLPQIFNQTAKDAAPITAHAIAPRDTSGHRSQALPIIALIETGNSTLASVLTAILMYSGLSAANTALYVASRTLYGFARNREPGDHADIIRRMIFRLSDVVSWTGVPLWGALLPAAILYWLPFIHIKEDVTKQLLQEVLLNIGSVSAVLVWCSQCLAYVCYYHRRQRFEIYIRRSTDEKIRGLLRDKGKHSLLSSGQPVWAYLGLIGTFVIVFVFNSVVLWNGRVFAVKFAAAFLSPILGIALWLGLKCWRTRFFTRDNVRHWGVNLGDYQRFEDAVQRLNGMINPVIRPPRRKRSLFDFFKGKGRDDNTSSNGVSPGPGSGVNANQSRVSPSSTGSESRTYQPGNFVPIDGEEENRTSDGRLYGAPGAYPTAGEQVAVPTQAPQVSQVPSVYVQDEVHEMANYPASSAPRPRTYRPSPQHPTPGWEDV